MNIIQTELMIQDHLLTTAPAKNCNFYQFTKACFNNNTKHRVLDESLHVGVECVPSMFFPACSTFHLYLSRGSETWRREHVEGQEGGETVLAHYQQNCWKCLSLISAHLLLPCIFDHSKQALSQHYKKNPKTFLMSLDL